MVTAATIRYYVLLLCATARVVTLVVADSDEAHDAGQAVLHQRPDGVRNRIGDAIGDADRHAALGLQRWIQCAP